MATRSENSLRIIGGEFRGRKLSFADLPGLRPTGDRLRETLFNWLAPYINGSRCADLFTGSGALALESLSRGAALVTALDTAPQVISMLRDHAKTLDCSQLQLFQDNSITWLTRQAEQSIDIVFIDPPFAQALWQPSIDALIQTQCLTNGAAIYIESGRDTPYQIPSTWRLHREKRAGQVTCRLYFNDADDRNFELKK
jgi:16S rRNA (guanine966-N2)-methyltransferase